MSGQIFAGVPAMKKCRVVNQEIYDAMREQVLLAVLGKILADYHKNRGESTLSVFNAIEIAPRMKGMWPAKVVPSLLRMMADAGDLELIAQVKKVEYIGPVVKYRLNIEYPFIKEKGRFFHQIVDIQKLKTHVQSIDPYQLKELTPEQALEAIGVQVKVRPEQKSFRKPGPARTRWV